MNTSYRSLQGLYTLITGDVGTGKTHLTRNLLKEAIKVETLIKILDFAPPSCKYKGVSLGGHLIEDNITNVIHYKSNFIKTPRISAKNSEELLKLAGINKEITENMLQKFTKEPSKILFINDVSIHLQVGNLTELLKAIELTETAVINGYLGFFLKPDHETGLSKREAYLMKKLGSEMDKVIHLKKRVGN